tara:strand:+ start:65 stop:283 length:219 start_codon:yes stop_codon:yes gene_type:complete
VVTLEVLDRLIAVAKDERVDTFIMSRKEHEGLGMIDDYKTIVIISSHMVNDDYCVLTYTGNQFYYNGNYGKE